MNYLFGDMVLFLACFLSIILLAKPLGIYISRVFEGKIKYLGPLENLIYRLSGINPNHESDWKRYALDMMAFNLFGVLILFIILLTQQFLPLNPQVYGGFSWDVALNAAISFVTNTNWQAYSGESSASYFTQMAGFGVQNFLSAATGICIAIALIRGIARHTSQTIGNFWADIVRCTFYLLLPASLLGAVFLISQGVIQNFDPYVKSSLMEPMVSETGVISQQILPMGPVASQESIKELGTNGGGFFNANSAHPYENPTPLTNIFQVLMILILPFALAYTFGHMVKDTRQGWAVFFVMMFFLLSFCILGYLAESDGNTIFEDEGLSGEYLEGKEVRFGTAGSILFAAATTGASCGAVNAVHDSLTPLGGAMPLVLILLGEIAPGGVGSGLYTILPYVIIAVFIAGLMIGRTPEYMGKKIEAIDMKASVAIALVPPIAVLLFSGIAVLLPEGISSIYNPGPHGATEIFYAFASTANNNGSSFSGLSSNTLFYNILTMLAMLVGRFAPAVAALALAGSMAKKSIYKSRDVFKTYNLTFMIWLIWVVLLIDTISFIPALALGPIVEQLFMLGGGVF